MVLELGNVIRQLREEKGLSQSKLAERIGISTSAIALYEVSERSPTISTLIKLARTLGVSTDYLLGLSNYKEDMLDVSGLTATEVNALNTLADSIRLQRNRNLEGSGT